MARSMQPSLEQPRLRVKEFTVGDVWFCTDTVRVVRVDSIGEIEVQTRNGLQTRPAVYVTSTIPDQPIPGHLSEKRAAKLRGLKAMLQVVDSNSASELDTRQWHEVWTEREVPTLSNPSGQAARALERRLIWQLYCHSEEGRQERQMRTSRLQGHAIEAERIDPEDVPLGLFGNAGPVPQQKAFTDLKLLTYRQLQDLARKHKIKGNLPRLQLEAALEEKMPDELGVSV